MKKNIKEEKNSKKKNIEMMDIIIFGIVFIMFVIALLSFFPGLVTSDNVDQINQAMLNKYNPAHPIIHSFIIGNLTKLGGIWVSALVQIIIFSTIWTYACKTVRKYNSSQKNKILQGIFTILIAITPLNFLYSITLWKDILYSYSILLLLVLIYIGIKEKFNYTNMQIILISLSATAIIMLRKNGLPIGVVMFVFLLILNVIKNKNKKNILKFISSFVLFLVLMNIPQWTVGRDKTKEGGGSVLNSTKVYCFGALLNNNIQLEDNEKDFLNTILDIEEWREKYDSFSGTPILFNNKLDNTVLANPEAEKRFNEIFIKYAKQNKKVVLKHFLNVNSIWWSVKEIGPMHSVIINNGSVSEMSNGKYDNKPIYIKGNEKLSDYTIKTLFKSEFYNVMYRPAVALYISIGLAICIIIKQKKTGERGYILLIFPMLINIATYVFLISSQDQRYFYPSFMTEYFIILVTIGTFFKKKELKEKKNNLKTNLDNPKVLIIIPAYNESETIEKVVNSVYEQNIEKCDVIIVNDGSSDDTLKEAKKTKAIVIDSPNNLGIGGAVQTGYLYALKNNYDIAIQIDGDGQHNPKYIKNLVEEIKKGNDIVIGSRFVEKSEYDQTKLRMLGINIISFIIKIMTKVKICDTTSGYRAVNKNIIKEFSKEYPYDYPEPCTNMGMIRKGYKIKEIPVEMEKRQAGISSISPCKSIVYMFKVILSILLMGLKD